MDTRHFVDLEGNYLGGFGTGALPDVPALEVEAPPHADCVWTPENGWAWPQDRLSARIRAERDYRLASCDWTQAPDATVDRGAWAAYRQALRDVTEQDGFPFAVQWPQEPTTAAVDKPKRTALTRRQLLIGLYRTGILDGAEALVAAGGGVPGKLYAALEALPTEAQIEARITFATFSEANRDDPIVLMLAASLGLADDEIDAMWDQFTLV